MADFLGAMTAASAALTGTGQPSNAETVIIGNNTYTFESTLTTDGTNTVKIGTDLASSMSNLAAAVNAGTGSGTVYGSGTSANDSVTAVAGTDTVTVTSRLAGTIGNGIYTAGTYPAGANASWDGVNLGAGTAGTGDSVGGIDDILANAQLNSVVLMCLYRLKGSA